MISVVCVYNNENTLKEVLLKGLEKQSARYELIALDNRGGKYKSASEALNYGGAKASGDYIMFVHQDMWLGSTTWLEDAEMITKSIPDLGVAGVAGSNDKGGNDAKRRRWAIEDFGELWQWGKGVTKPEEVQTLDECLLIVPKTVFSKLKFDEKVFDGWDCYGADYCLCARRLGLKAYVIPVPYSHCCLRATYQLWEFKELLEFHRRLYAKHSRDHKHIYLWAGEISRPILWGRAFMSFLGPLYLKLFPNFYITLKRELSGCQSVLDLGCGCLSPIHKCNISYSIGVDLFEQYLQESKMRDIHKQYIKADVRRIEFKPKSFDAVIAIEVLEHLTKQEGAELLNKMEQWARKKVIITTPNGYLHQDTYDDNPLQEHMSGWRANEFRKLGFRVFGLHGWKRLRGPKSLIRFRPIILWSLISNLTQKITYYYPKLAFQLLAVKHVKEADTK